MRTGAKSSDQIDGATHAFAFAVQTSGLCRRSFSVNGLATAEDQVDAKPASCAKATWKPKRSTPACTCGEAREHTLQALAVRRHGANHQRIRELPVTVPAREAPPPSQHTREPEVNDSRHRTSW
jgi:hypothetical protein